MFWDVAAVLMIIAGFGQIMYLSMLGGRTGRFSGKVIHPDAFGTVFLRTHLPVSVIICAKNEAQNLQNNLESVLTQEDYQKGSRRLFEVIVVDDASTDNTQEILQQFSLRHEHLHVVTISPDEGRDLPGKKFALGKGVDAANHDNLLLTDADCKPASNQWLRRMVSPLLAGKSFVAGYGAMRQAPGLLNKFIRCETVFTFLQLHGMAALGMPYMAVGRNLAVKKELLLAARGQELWKQSPSGDDDLLVRLFATKDNYYVNAHPQSFTFSDAKNSLAGYVSQKQRHLSTGKFYKAGIKFWLGLNGLSHVLYWLMLPLVLGGWMSGHEYGRLTLFIWLSAFRAFWLWFRMWEWSDRLNEKDVIAFAPIFDLLLAAYNIIFAPYILWKTKQRWK